MPLLNDTGALCAQVGWGVKDGVGGGGFGVKFWGWQYHLLEIDKDRCDYHHSHAYQILSGNSKFDPQKGYLKVGDPKWVTNSADFFFSQHGYGDVKEKTEILGHASSIRNRVAHSSEKCRYEFKVMAFYFLASPSQKLEKGYGPGNLLMENVARHF